MNKFNVGDWVKGKSKEDEFFIGYIEQINESSVHVYIIQSDHSFIKNRTVKIASNKIEVMEQTDLYFEGSLLNLIDIALLEKNEEDFIKYSSQLKELKMIHNNEINIEEINFIRREGFSRIKQD
ncbi:hypothetical protein [Chengkuizengella axinellae]|uniref:IDEAL domain-containing protein n=1 Tax=Chengkuizengella axinellae TaxID=3064388 RepID=A0ABT9J4T9_9BACL|nr:hypothetical protein [Chengkuizengella sp. 2205SS18-9]MDP5276482.1 hypothetical protein [Chengkuizengella sp. 2205SS18-9]